MKQADDNIDVKPNNLRFESYLDMARKSRYGFSGVGPFPLDEGLFDIGRQQP